MLICDLRVEKVFVEHIVLFQTISVIRGSKIFLWNGKNGPCSLDWCNSFQLSGLESSALDYDMWDVTCDSDRVSRPENCVCKTRCILSNGSCLTVHVLPDGWDNRGGWNTVSRKWVESCSHLRVHNIYTFSDHWIRYDAALWISWFWGWRYFV